MNDQKQICPFCGANEFERKEQEQEEKMALCHFYYQKVVDVCLKCGEEFDFSGENDERFLQAYEKTKKASLKQMMKELEEQKFSMAYIERALELSQRTLSQWKSNGTSAAGMALLRMIYTFPWLLKVADRKYDKGFSRRELLAQAAKLYGEDEKKNQVVSSATPPTSSSGSNVSQDLVGREETTKTVEIIKRELVAA